MLAGCPSPWATAMWFKGNPVATVALLGKAFKEFPDTTLFSLFARSEIPALAEPGGTAVRADASVLGGQARACRVTPARTSLTL